MNKGWQDFKKKGTEVLKIQDKKNGVGVELIPQDFLRTVDHLRLEHKGFT